MDTFVLHPCLKFRKNLFVVLVLLSSKLLAQHSVYGELKDTNNVPIEFVAVGLLNAKDSSIVAGVLSDDKGKFSFKNVQNGQYFVRIRNTGMTDFNSSVFNHDSIGNTTLPVFTIKNDPQNLQEVAVTVLKKAVEFKNGNVTVNVENSPLAAGNTVYDLLSRMPGVLVTNEQITLQGKPVSFMLNNRLQQVTGTQLINLLKSINASEVSKIELISNPPAKYDAAGSGGLINIVTKKTNIVGFSGSAFYSYSQGFYANNYTQISLNYKGKKVSVFTNLNANYSDYRSENFGRREVWQDSILTILNQHYIEKNTNQFVSLWGGVDWYVSKKSTVSLRLNYRPGKEIVTRQLQTDISNADLGYSSFDFNFEKPNTWFWQDYDLNFERLLDTTGGKFSVNASYSEYPDLYEGSFTNRFYDFGGNETGLPRIFTNTNQVHLSFLTFRTDFEKMLRNKIKIESGLKSATQSMASDFRFNNFNHADGAYIFDTMLSNRFEYNEQITAAYFDLQKEIKKFNFRAGVRAEHTNIRALSRTNDATFNREYSNLFPSGSIDYNHSDKHNYQLTYNRRINRADYNNFNPFRGFRSILTYVQGNPYLNPMYTHNVTLRHTYKGKISNSFSYSGMRNYFISYNIENKRTKELIFYNGNLDRATIMSYGLFIQEDFYKKWNCTVNLGIHYFECEGLVDGIHFKTSNINSNIYTSNLIALNSSTKLEISCWVVGPWRDGVTQWDPRGSLNIGVRKNLLKDKLTINLSLQDILYTQKINSEISAIGQYSQNKHQYDSRRAQITLNYNFGKIKVEQKRIKENEEKSRAGR